MERSCSLKQPKIQTYSKRGGSKNPEMKMKKAEIWSKEKNSSTQLRRSHHKLKFPAKKSWREMNDEKQKPIKTIRKNHQISNFSNWTMNMCVCAKDWIDRWWTYHGPIAITKKELLCSWPKKWISSWKIWVPSDLQWSPLLFLPAPFLLREFRGHF